MFVFLKLFLQNEKHYYFYTVLAIKQDIKTSQMKKITVNSIIAANSDNNSITLFFIESKSGKTIDKYGNIDFNHSEIKFVSEKENEATELFNNEEVATGDMKILYSVVTNNEGLSDYSELDTIEELPMFEFKNYNEIKWEEGRGKSVADAIIIQWSWQTYVGYAHRFVGLRRGKSGETESDLLDDRAANSTFVTNESVLLTEEEVAACNNDDELLDAICEELEKSYWKWTGFVSRPVSNERIIDMLNLSVTTETESE